MKLKKLILQSTSSEREIIDPNRIVRPHIFGERDGVSIGPYHVRLMLQGSFAFKAIQLPSNPNYEYVIGKDEDNNVILVALTTPKISKERSK